MRVLVTGAGGFVGRWLVPRLAAAGHDVLAAIRPHGRPSPASPPGAGGVRRIETDLAAPGFTRLLPTADAVIALAQSGNFRNFPREAGEIFAVNVAAQLALLQWARELGVRRFVYASSGGIYGARARPFVQETDLLAVDSPLGFYLGTKLCAEVIFQNFRQFFDTAVILRPFFVYGPGQRTDMLIPRLIESVRIGRPIQLQGESGLRLNPIFVEDAAAAFTAALALEGCHVLNVAGPDVLSLREIGEAIGRRVRREPVFERVPGTPSDYVANTEAARTLLRMPQTPFEEGLARTVAGA